MTPKLKEKIWGKDFKFCPECGESETLRFLQENIRRQVCDSTNGGCGYVRWNSPVPTVVSLVPFPAEFAGKGEGFNLDSADLDLERFSDPSNTAVLLARRAIPPFVGKWVLPGGHLEPGETPRRGALRELLEETGVVGGFETSLHPCNPLPGRLNQVTMHMLVRPMSGTLQARDDVDAVEIFSMTDLPQIPFGSHKKTLKDYFQGLCGVIEGRRRY